MKTFFRLACAAAAVTVFSIGAGAQSAPEYLPTSEAGPHGSAPGMQVKQLSDSNGQKDYAVIFRPGDEPYAGLTQFARAVPRRERALYGDRRVPRREAGMVR